MDWVSNRVYSFNSIVRALDNKKEKIVDNAKFPLLSTSQYDKVIIIGGGENAVLHKEGIKEFIRKNLSVALIYATSRNAMSYFDLDCPKYYCLVGTEGKRLSKTVGEKAFNNICVLPPYPRKMGTDVPEFAVRNTFELGKIEFTTQYPDSCTAIALQIAIDLGAKETYIVGYDGYPGEILSEKEMVLTHENKILFTDYSRFINKPLVSLTPTLYKELEIKSIYQYI